MISTQAELCKVASTQCLLRDYSKGCSNPQFGSSNRVVRHIDQADMQGKVLGPVLSPFTWRDFDRRDKFCQRFIQLTL